MSALLIDFLMDMNDMIAKTRATKKETINSYKRVKKYRSQ